MRKIVVVLLVLTLLVLIGAPALAVETRTSRICPACGGTGYERTFTEHWEEGQTCDNWPSMIHYHTNTYRVTYSVCEDCGTKVYISRVLYSSECWN